MAKERPIIMSGPMVRAILDGRKTQTRRVVKPQPPVTGGVLAGYSVFTPEGRVSFRGRDQNGEVAEWFVKRPWDPGDLLYVRETWRTTRLGGDHTMPTFGAPGSGVCVEWRAGGGEYEACNFDEPDWCSMGSRDAWRPSIHMPKWAARIWLRVTDVRVERVMDISVEDAQAEGVEPVGQEGDSRRWRGGFRDLWDSIYDKRGFGWDTNPWVWVVAFEVVQRD